MHKIENGQIKPVVSGTEINIKYVFPKSEEIIIDKSNLQIQFDKFKKKIKEGISIYDILAVVALWIPFISADFKSLFGQTPDAIRFGYFIFALIITISIVIYKVPKKNSDSVDSDPEKMAQKILDQCRKRK